MNSFLRTAGFVSIGAIVAICVTSVPSRAGDDSKDRIDRLEKQVNKLQSKLQYMRVVQGGQNGLSGPHVIFEGCNFHIRSGSGDTQDGGAPLGLGNLIVGYNEAPTILDSGRGGSHNLIVGMGHSYTSVAGVVFGNNNTVSGEHSSVIGGYVNTASEGYSSVSGGRGNIASDDFAAVAGGYSNTASGGDATVSGGAYNVASGPQSTVSGGDQRTASGQYDWAAGSYSQDS